MVSIRSPPTLDVKKAVEFACKEFERDPPYNAKVKATTKGNGMGWNAKKMTKQFQDMIEDCSMNFYG